ncbi:VWA domain-containing protein [Hamadaea tsunoensis]|uniref:VWA domain-containing protein n=1 Tax=Hamadaea tsunoensis TaxID=53368 RepID=UPI00040E8F20|nr:VWA domain-containing protein [Hamadaea tsunoensis]
MTLAYPIMWFIAALVTAAGATAYVMLVQKRSEALRTQGLVFAGPGRRRHVPYALFLVALPLLLIAVGRPEATISLPRVSGTVIVVVDVSKSMAADDVKPTRLAAAQEAATGFVKAQPDTVDVGVVIFGQDSLTTQPPSADHGAALGAINRLTPSGGTSLGQAILAGLGAIVGHPVALPDAESGAAPPDLGYWGSATMVLFSDGESRSGPDVESAAALAATAGVRIETVGIGTKQGTTVEVDGYQVATALNEDLLTAVATQTGGAYHPAGSAADLDQIHKSIDLRLTAKPEKVELTGLLGAAGLLLLTIGGALMIGAYGRIV